MKKILCILFGLGMIINTVKSQGNLLPPNGNFEDLITFSYPVGYITSMYQGMDLSGITVTKVPGDNSNYGVRLETKPGQSMLVGNIFNYNAGYIYYQNAQGKTGFPFVQKPKFFKGSFKYNCINGDSAMIIVDFRKNGQSVSQNYFYLYGTKNVYTQTTFNLKAFSDTPDTLILGFVSSNLIHIKPNIGNWLIVDNISFTDISFQIPDGDFETWNDGQINAPQNWNSLNSFFVSSPPVYSGLTIDMHAGNYSMQIKTDTATINNKHGQAISYITSGNFIIQNIINNNLSNITKGGFPIDSNPSGIEFYYKYNNSDNTNDSALVIADFSKYTNSTHYNMGRFIARLKPSADYVSQSLQFNIGNPNLPAGTQADTANIIISSSNYLSSHINLMQCIGNNLIIDDLIFYYNAGYKLSGVVSYDNNKNTALSGIKVYLKNSSNVRIDSTTTDKSGNYQFNSVANGSYTLEAATTKTAYAPKPSDALMVNRYFIGTFTIKTNLRKLAADVDNNKKIQPTDALWINRHYIGTIKNFKIPNWLFENPAVTINGADNTTNFKGICAGDVNGNFTPQ